MTSTPTSTLTPTALISPADTALSPSPLDTARLGRRRARCIPAAAPQGLTLFWHDHCEACNSPDNAGQRWCTDCDWDA